MRATDDGAQRRFAAARRPPKRPTAPRKAPPAEGGEILHHCRRWVVLAGSLTPVPVSPSGRGEAGWLGRGRRAAHLLLDALDERLRLALRLAYLALDLAARGPHLALGLATGRPHLALRLAAVALHEASGLGAALPQLPLDPRPRALDLAHRAVARGVAATLELAEAG